MGMTINAGALSGADEEQRIKQSRHIEQPKKEQETKNIYGGDLALKNDPIAQRRKEAQNAAWRVVNNAWGNDESVDGFVKEKHDQYAAMEETKKDAADAISGIKEEKEELRMLYGVASDSREQKDLELLEKEQDIKNGVVHSSLTPEEAKRLGEIHQNPLTEYQQRALERNSQAGEFKKTIADMNLAMRDTTADIYGIQQERLKSSPMLEAQQAADSIMETANEEIIGMLVQEAKDHIDEKMEEAEEKAEKSLEEKEKKDEELQQTKLERAMQKAMIEGTKEAEREARAASWKNYALDFEISEMITIVRKRNPAEDVGRNLDEIKNSMKLLEADLKGIKVNEET